MRFQVRWLRSGTVGCSVLQKPEIFLLCHLPSIDLVKDAPVEAEDDKLYTISEISSTYRWRR